MPDVRMISIKRVKNLGNFENVSVEMQAAIDVGEDPKKALSSLADQVEEWQKDRYPISAKR